MHNQELKKKKFIYSSLMEGFQAVLMETDHEKTTGKWETDKTEK